MVKVSKYMWTWQYKNGNNSLMYEALISSEGNSEKDIRSRVRQARLAIQRLNSCYCQ